MRPSIRIDAPKFWDEGYLLIRNVFSRAEIEEFRQHGFKDRQWKGELLCHPHLRKAILDDRILDIAAQILGDTPVYCGDSTFNIGLASFDYHKDNPDRFDSNGPDWKEGRFTPIRFAIYMEDHAWHSGGLRLIPGSHKSAVLRNGKPRNVRSRVGDIVVWDQRLSHAGSAMMLRLLPWAYIEVTPWVRQKLMERPRTPGCRYMVPIQEPLAMRVPRILLASDGPERGFLSFSLGLEDAHMERWIAYLMSREYAVEKWKHSEYGADVWDAVRGKNIKLIDVGAEVRRRLAAGDTSLGVNVNWEHLAY
jgi:hypothetical protein